jgi:hypothetical protein
VAQAPCERCGTFIQGEPFTFGPKEVCESCSILLRQQIRLYSTNYTLVLGLLGNFAMAGVLCAINWKRLGDRTRMRNATIVAVVGVVWVAFGMVYNVPGGVMLGANIIGTMVAMQSMKDAYQQHRREGGADANKLWPVLSLIGVILLAGVILTFTEL